jgi:hypothetical protein
MDLLDRHQALVLLEFNSWAMMGAADVHPKEFAKWIFAHFSHVYRVRHGGGDDYLERQSADGALNFLYANLIHDSVVSDLLVTNFERRLTPLPNRLQPALAASIARENEMARARDAALAERDLARAGRDAAEAARDVAIAERDALLRSTSWKVTASLRALSSAIRPR